MITVSREIRRIITARTDKNFAAIVMAGANIGVNYLKVSLVWPDYVAAVRAIVRMPRHGLRFGPVRMHPLRLFELILNRVIRP